jgi:hypothetical protein
MLKKISALIICVLIVVTVNAQSFEWVRSGGEIERDAGRAVCTDNEGNVIIAGYFSGKVFFDTLYQGRGTDDAFITKFNAAGDLLWVKTLGGPLEDLAYGIDTDDDGNIYVTGDFDSMIIIENRVLFSSGGKDIFIAKFNSDGDLLWAERAGGTGFDSGNAIAVDKEGSAYVTGRFENFAAFGTEVVTSNGFFDVFFAKYDTDGNLVWLKKSGGVKEDVGLGIAVDTFNNCYATGYFHDVVDFEVAVLSTPSTSSEIFVLKIDSVGEYDFAVQAGSLRGDVAYAITVDDNRNSYITGYFADIAYFESHSVTAVANNDVFVAKYSAKGVCLWAKSAGGRLLDIGTGIDVAEDGSVYITGVIDTIAFFETDTVFLSRKDDVFIAKYDRNGNYQWVKTAGGANSQIPLALCIGHNKDVYITGYYYTQLDFGDTIIYQPNDADIFVAKLYDPLLSVFEKQKATISVNLFPNPAWSSIHAESASFLNKELNINITDVSGKTVYEMVKYVDDSSIEIDVSTFNNGLYLLQFVSDNFSATQRLVIAR